MNASKYFIEDKSMELKLQFTNTLLKSISAFSNYHDGKILLGVDDNGSIKGILDVNEEVMKVENIINDSIHPKPYYELRIIEIEKKHIIEICVFYGEHQPYLYKGVAYCRHHTASVPVDDQELKKLVLLGKKITFDSLVFNEHKELSFEILRSRLRERLGIESVEENVLRTLGLMNQKVYTNAADLLSDRPVCKSAKIDLVRFSGTSVSHIVDRKTLSNISIIDQFDACIKFFEKHINTQEIILGAYRQTIIEVPIVAYREAIANVVVHRDYSHMASSRVEIYDDRIMVISIGGLPYGINEDEYSNGSVSIPRNPIIADVFLRLGIIEKLATGIRRIKEAYSNRSLSPKFDVGLNSVIINLPKELISPVESEISMTPLQNLIVNYLKVHGEIKRSDVENIGMVGKTKSAKLLAELLDKGILLRHGNGRSISYTLR